MERESFFEDKFNKKLSYFFLAIIAIFTFLLNFFRIHDAGFGNTYYAVTVKSMLTSWHNFIFASYDPGGFVTVDKPPIALWIQCASTALFGFKGWSLLLPQAIAGVISVLVLYRIVSMAFGVSAGLVSSLVLAVTPIFAAVSRTNELDPILVMMVLLAALAANISAQKGNLLWLILAMALIGLAFNTKMMEAYLALPAFYSLYFFSAPLKTVRKVSDLVIASAVLVTVSLSWAVFVDMTPPDRRPFVGSSQNNSELNLAIGYNGINRVLPRNRGRGTNQWRYAGIINRESAGLNTAADTEIPDPQVSGTQAGMPGRFRGGMGGEGGSPGILRIFNEQMAGQISWLFPIELTGIIVLIIRLAKRGIPVSNPVSRSVIFWSSWVLPMLIYFSETGFFHRYYLSMLSPGLAALCGIGIKILWESYREEGWEGWMLPLSLMLNALLQALFLSRYPGWIWLAPPVLGMTLITAAFLTLRRLSGRFKNPSMVRSSVIICFAALLVSPLIWSITPILYGDQESAPFAGPELLNRYSYPWVAESTNSQAGFIWGGLSAGDNLRILNLSRFLTLSRKEETFIAGVPSAMIATPIILNTGQPVMAMGGFMGRDNILSTVKLERMVGDGDVRFFLIAIPDTNQTRGRRFGPGFMTNQGNLPDLFKWIKENGKLIPREIWYGGDTNLIETNDQIRPGRMGGLRNMQLYDCSPGRTIQNKAPHPLAGTKGF